MRNQKGFTLVELLVGMAILSIVAAAITSFIVAGSRSYAAANTEIVVQQESQLAMNQISDVVIDTTRSVNYVGYAADGSVSQQAVKDADFTIDVEDKSLTLFNGVETQVFNEHGVLQYNPDGSVKTEITGGNGNQKNYQFYYDKSEEKLYYSEIELSDDVFPEAGRVLLAEYVKDFSADLSQVEEKRVVQLTVSYEYNNRIFDTSNNITIRNKVLVNDINLEIDKTVELSIRPKENMVVLEPGENYYKFSTPRIDGRNIIDKSVKWEILPEEQSKLTGSDTGFTDEANGIIHISSQEKVNSFEVTVTTNAVDSEGNHASAKVVVYVKRVKSVALNKSADSDSENGAAEISAGSTITISAHAEGNKLGVTCSNCGDDTSIDKYVVDNENAFKWTIVEDINNICTMTSSGHESADFTISSAAKPGNRIIIEATSLLSVTGNAYGRNYDRVFGRITLTVANHKRDISLGGDFKYGDEPLTLTWDYPHAYGLVCVRIKEEDENAPMSEDKVMIFNTDGKAIRIGADLFGLNLNHNYYISMQVLDYQLDMNAADYAAKRDALVVEYESYLDSTGTYYGSISSSDKLTVELLKPQLTFEYNGKKYKGEEIDIAPIYALKGYADISCPLTEVSSTRSEGERVKNDAKVNLYRGSGQNEALYYFNDSTGQYVDTTGNGGVGALVFGDCLMHNPEKLKIKLDGNKSAMDAVGSYQYIPVFKYSNAADAARFKVHYSNYTPDYDVHYYERPESAINFTIIDSGNLSLWMNVYGTFVNGEIYFPTPSDGAFRDYFTLNNPAVQSIIPSNNYFRLLDKDGNIHGFGFSRMTCEYISTEDSYVIELFYECTDSLWDRKVEMSAGRFKCPAGGNEWSRITAGDLDEQLNKGNTKVIGNGNARINITNGITNLPAGSYEAYIPLPTEGGFTNNWYGNFGFDLKEIKSNPGTEISAGNINGTSIKYRKDENGVPQAYSLSCSAATCSYDVSTKTYTLTIKCYKPGDWDINNAFELGKFTYTEGGTSWKTVN